MTIRIAINGFGRIGRSILRAFYEAPSSNMKNLQIVAINDLGNPVSLAHLTKYDSTHGTFKFSVGHENGYLIVDQETDHKIQMLSIRDPSCLPWKKLGVDIVLECTGLFTDQALAQQHLSAGAKKVLISAPAGDKIKTIVYGINHKTLNKEDKIVSNASCTTNCLAPLVWALNQNLTIISGLMTTVHSYTNDQVLTDIYHQDLRRARSATTSLIPTKTGAASALGLVMPELNGKLDGFAIRVPTLNVSIVDLSVIIEQQTTVNEVNDILKFNALSYLPEITAINELPLVSIDFNHNSASSIFDLTQTKVVGQLVKVLSWYDNEWGFANRMLDTALFMGQLQ
jgi:glyceraldehyde 3-phosphate dehydrogenase